MNRYKSLFAVFAFSLLVLTLPAIASAQWGGNNRRNDDDYYGRNNRNLNSTIKNLKNRSRSFERRIDRELDRSRINGSRREDRINDIAADFARAADDLENRYDNRNDYGRSENEARRVLQLGAQLDRALGRGRFNNGNIQNDWSRIQQDLRVLANAYGGYYNDDDNYRNNRRGRNNRDDDDDYYGNGRGNNRNNRNGDWRNQIPFPLPF